MRIYRMLLILGLTIAGEAQSAPRQTATMPPLLSPGAAYQEALRPLTVTRASVANWSATEQAALAVAVQQAARACEVRAAGDYNGDALVDLARLCSMGQDFPTSVQATQRYLAADEPAKARLAEAYAMQVDGQLHLKDEKAALATAREMLDRAPFGSAVSDATSEAINYMELLFTADAEMLARMRQPKLLAAMHAGEGTRENDPAAVSLPDLLAQALVLPELQQLAGNPAAAAASLPAINAAVPANITPDDAIAAAGWRRRYAQLGQPLGTFDAIRTLTTPAKMPQIPARRAITALLLFPDWCAQCVRLARQIPESVFSVEGHEAYMYGLLVETVKPKEAVGPPTRPNAEDAAAYDPADAADELQGTASLVVGSPMLTRFDAVEVPLLIVVDASGVVRFISPVDETALRPGNTVDSAVARVGAQWPETDAPGRPANSPHNAAPPAEAAEVR